MYKVRLGFIRYYAATLKAAHSKEELAALEAEAEQAAQRAEAGVAAFAECEEGCAAAQIDVKV